MSKQKLDEALGIKGGIEEFLSDLNVEDDVKQLQDIDDKVNENVNKLDSQIEEYKKYGVEKLNFEDIESSLSEIKELIIISKDTLKHAYESFCDSELCDSELLGAIAKMMETSHLTVQEYINLYKDKQSFFDKVRLQMIKHEQDMQKIKYKHDLDMEKLNAMQKKNEKIADVQNGNQAYSQEDIIKMIQENN